ncbi:hypothetical protein [Tengunoibacter tsumagoiensis]|uniref:Uncharacterized protein n=1 Tax=Tengunoibacter tsumagoiensis TaxID=2014871 RepID=A0A402A824_9CHLR|nr:hypothetical protein [Tengunoibacter tsumagoiensis]GCE15317.1 hypothetical protein KTT_51760 [Tengunoibacter tsumagoiensis]
MLFPQSSKQGTSFRPNMQLCFCIVFGVGVVACFTLLAASLFVAAYVLNLACTAFFESITYLTTLYSGSDSLVKFLLICLFGYAILRVGRWMRRSWQMDREVHHG